ncbi:hypothetical protein CYMTET_41859, partial [Cymbomonas tetramitiformis]
MNLVYVKLSLVWYVGLSETLQRAASAYTMCGEAAEHRGNDIATITCNAGDKIEFITFASYGEPEGECGDYSIHGCHASNSETPTGNPTSHPIVAPRVDEEQADETTVVASASTAGVLVAAGGGSQMALQLQTLAMLHYLAIPHKPRSFSTANYLFRWFNFQVSFPMDVQLDEFCGDQEEEETSFAEPFIHESVPEKALHMAVNTGTAVLSVAALLALLSFVMWANGWTAPASLTFPRSHILLLQFSVSGLFQGCGFALAHATWQGMVLAFAIIGSVCFYMWRVVIALHR